MLGQLLGSVVGGISSLIGGNKSQKAMEKQNAANIQLQKDFAQKGIQWKVEDAKAAGIHPLYALGANTHSFAPVSVGDSMGPAIASAGQNLGRAIAATDTGSGRASAVVQALAVEHAGLQNQLLRSQIRRMDAQTPPPSPVGASYLIDGQGDTTIPVGQVSDQPLKRIAPGASPHQEPGAITDMGYARTPTGWAVVPSKDVKERIEDMIIPEISWGMRNWILPINNPGHHPPFPAPPGMQWHFDLGKTEYQLKPYVRGPKSYPRGHSW